MQVTMGTKKFISFFIRGQKSSSRKTKRLHGSIALCIPFIKKLNKHFVTLRVLLSTFFLCSFAMYGQ